MSKKKNNNNQNNGEQKVEATTTNQEKKEEKNNNNKEAVFKTHIHCEGCSNKVSDCLRGYFGVEEVVIDKANSKVIVKGQKIDPMKVLKRLQDKFSKHVELISPKPNPNASNPKKETEKKEEPKMKVLVVKMHMHCEGCANEIKKKVEKMQGIMVVEPDMKKSTVVIRGLFDPPKLVELIRKRLGKHVEILTQEDVKGKAQQAQEKGPDEKNMFHYPPQYATHICPSQIFSDENVFSCSIM
ncbi:hypothetical protein HS088_TW10G00178 [Tripterygium wilfordii]|uniref:HMA domain-containing protein n=1 Tax=Tripterygium wilfordii TaxID=458696 RepID=A0A7J7D4D5_TRIWF|nr:hypothetical protein HS088_TW10G00178 [Tripterygium wilfordii]